MLSGTGGDGAHILVGDCFKLVTVEEVCHNSGRAGALNAKFGRKGTIKRQESENKFA